MIAIKTAADSLTFGVRVHPRAKHNAITGILGDRLKLSITAPPADSRANQAVIEFFADALRVPRSSITIAAGQTSRNKVVRIITADPAGLRPRLERLAGSIS